MLVIILSVLALVAGPLLHRLARAGRGALDALDGFVFAIVGGMVLLAFAPRAIATAGTAGLGAVIAGFVALALAERVTDRTLDRALWPLAVVALGFHEFIDGLALSSWQAGGRSDALLPTAIVLHRIPVGVALWWLVEPALGFRRAALALALVAVAIVAGFVSGAGLAASLSGTAVGVVQGFIAGAFLHALLHRPGAHADGPHEHGWELASGMGGLAGVALLMAVHDADAAGAVVAGHLDAGPTFVALALAVAPMLVLAYALEWVAPPRPAPLHADGLLVTLPLLGTAFAGARLVAAAAFALAFRRMFRAGTTPTGTPWMLAGLALAAAVEPLVPPEWLALLPPAAWVAVAALVGVPAYLSAGAATPIAAVLVHKGLSPGAALAFLMTAPLPVAAEVRRAGARALVPAGLAVVLAVAAGLGVDRFVAPAPFPLHQAAEAPPAPIAVACLMALAVLVALGILREGPRGYVGEVFRRHH
jgi:uncharacterized membrane protein YraQ (UPF0718 family)